MCIRDRQQSAEKSFVPAWHLEQRHGFALHDFDFAADCYSSVLRIRQDVYKRQMEINACCEAMKDQGVEVLSMIRLSDL